MERRAWGCTPSQATGQDCRWRRACQGAALRPARNKAARMTLDRALGLCQAAVSVPAQGMMMLMIALCGLRTHQVGCDLPWFGRSLV